MLTILAVSLCCLLMVGGILAMTGALFGKAPFTGPTFQVRKEKLKITIVARGSLESAMNGDIICRVRSGTKGSTIATTIKEVIDAGKEVQKDDLVMVLDDSGFNEQKKDKIKDVNTAYALKIQADQQYEIQKLDNETDIEKAENAFKLAKIDLEKYSDGDFVQAIKDVEGRIETSTSDLEDWKTRAAWSARMSKKGLVSKVQADTDANRVDAARITVQKLEEEKRVLVDPKYGLKERTVTDLKSKLAEADQNLKKTRLQAKFKLEFLAADKKTKQSIYDLETTRLEEIEAQIKACTIRAPQAGLVVYYVPDQVRGGGGSQQSIIAQGEPVREGQKLMQIPDLENMLVNVRVPEAFVDNLRIEKDKAKWQLAQIKVDAFQSRKLLGHVKFVDTVASAQDFFAADVKVYKTLVAIDLWFKLTDASFEYLREEELPEHLLSKLNGLKNKEFPSRKLFLADLRKVFDQEDVKKYQDVILRNAKDPNMPSLKPGMSAEVTITAEESTEPVLVVPIQSVIGTISMGAERKCFVVGPNGQPAMRDITVGMSNERLVEVKAGLEEGERVVENPRPLIEEGSDMKPAKVRGGKNGDDPGSDGGPPVKGKDKNRTKSKTGKGPVPKTGAMLKNPSVEFLLAVGGLEESRKRLPIIAKPA